MLNFGIYIMIYNIRTIVYFQWYPKSSLVFGCKFCVLCTFMLWIDLFVHCCRSTSWWPSPIPPRQHETWWDYLPPNTNSAPRNRGPERYVTLSDTAGRKRLYTYLYTTVQQTNSICAQKLSTYQNYMKVYLHTLHVDKIC